LRIITAIYVQKVR